MMDGEQVIESSGDVLRRKDAEFAEWIATRAPDWMVVKYAREFIEVKMNATPDGLLNAMDNALCARLEALQETLRSGA